MAQHHSDLDPLVAALDAAKEKPELGATGEFPRGRMNENDEGELRFGIGVSGKKVVIDFGKPVRSLGLDPENAFEISEMLRRAGIHAVTGIDVGSKRGEG